jgi:hypothetical protein
VAAACAASASFAADPAAGKKVAQGTCAVCHGLDGIAKLPDAPHLAAENVEYLMRQLKAFKSGERKHEQMSIIAQGMSDEQMDQCLADQELTDGILQTRLEGQNEHQVSSTPTLVINGEAYPGARSSEELSEVIDPLLGGS